MRVNGVNPGVIITELQKRGGLDDEAYAKFLEHSKTTHALGMVLLLLYHNRFGHWSRVLCCFDSLCSLTPNPAVEFRVCAVNLSMTFINPLHLANLLNISGCFHATDTFDAHESVLSTLLQSFLSLFFILQVVQVCPKKQHSS